MKKLSNYIDGQLIPPVNKSYINNYNPSNGKPYSLTPDSCFQDVKLASKAAKKAFKNWSEQKKEFRYAWMMKLAKAIDDNSKNLIVAESRDNGKPEWLAEQVDIPRCSENFRFFATAMLHFESKCHNMNNDALNYTLKKPVGVAGCISPWNLPLYLLTWKIAPAIAAGNTVIAKPSEVTPYTAYLFSKICAKINFPKGVINIVHGLGKTAGSSVVKYSDIISFTGGTETGRVVATSAAKDFKKCSLELGGKNPTVVFNDCDFESTIDIAIKSGFLNQGQICLCGSRIFIEESIYTKFRTAFVKKAKNVLVGDPKNPNNNLGAIVSEEHLNKIISKINLAKRDGGKILCGGDRLFLKGKLSGGYYLKPTVIEGLDYKHEINQEEIFGPVVTLIPFNREKDLIKMCNSTKYGLSASIFSNNVSKAHRVAAKIDAGVIWVNTWLLRDLRIPFGGVKHSGLGREGGFYSLEFFTESKNVCIKIENGVNK
ncbi:MAG: 2-hydroxymuconic semialdehyde dehydrogenase [Flavobacteriales bacterium]|nr:2-hydroxymuconic semialdehyde dehydrogenase [Flavobacteriales bacterium]|tara:strand:+ start:42892 stop:44346 length:1455 start_codon:yes stop_codon:yes gene_type:complete